MMINFTVIVCGLFLMTTAWAWRVEDVDTTLSLLYNGTARSRLLLPEKNRAQCTVTRSYHPSAADIWWRSNIDKVATSGVRLKRNNEDGVKNWELGCAALQQHENVIHAWMKLWAKREKPVTPAELSKLDTHLRGNKNEHLLPFLEYTESCPRNGGSESADIGSSTGGDETSVTKTVTRVPIEPLIGFLRHPQYLCFTPGNDMITNKDYLFPAHALEVFPSLSTDASSGLRRGKAFFFDLGCSEYSSGFGGASQNWFVEGYAARGIHFDRILAWEANHIDPGKLFAGYPAEVLDVLSYFNVPADPGPAAKENPLRIMRDLCSPDDFVVLKLDIDTAHVEAAFVQQLLADPVLLALVDEFYFEHHVRRNPLEHGAWDIPKSNSVDKGMEGKDFGFTHLVDPPAPPGAVAYVPGTVRAENDITASYEIFNILRENGIRAHSWV